MGRSWLRDWWTWWVLGALYQRVLSGSSTLVSTPDGETMGADNAGLSQASLEGSAGE